MKTVVAASLLSAVAASSLTWVIALATAPPPIASGASMTAAEFKSALGDLEREVAALRREGAERGARPSPGTVSTSPSSSRARLPAGEKKSDGGEAADLVLRPSAGASAPLDPVLPVSQEVVERLKELKGWGSRPEVRARWLLLPEGGVLEQLGLPDRIIGNQVEEHWYYEVPTGEMDEEGKPTRTQYQVILNRGRLVQVF